jgi:hypothetical protein
VESWLSIALWCNASRFLSEFDVFVLAFCMKWEHLHRLTSVVCDTVSHVREVGLNMPLQTSEVQVDQFQNKLDDVQLTNKHHVVGLTVRTKNFNVFHNLSHNSTSSMQWEKGLTRAAATVRPTEVASSIKFVALIYTDIISVSSLTQTFPLPNTYAYLISQRLATFISVTSDA